MLNTFLTHITFDTMVIRMPKMSLLDRISQHGSLAKPIIFSIPHTNALSVSLSNPSPPRSPQHDTLYFSHHPDSCSMTHVSPTQIPNPPPKLSTTQVPRSMRPRTSDVPHPGASTLISAPRSNQLRQPRQVNHLTITACCPLPHHKSSH